MNRNMLRNWLIAGKKPVATRTSHNWDRDEHEVYETNYVDFYACVRPSVDSSILCFYPDFVSEAKKMGIEVVENENGFELLEKEDKYEQMAAELGYLA
jgi:phosphosulfolactate synthase (CoM biosynthesis protein A)